MNDDPDAVQNIREAIVSFGAEYGKLLLPIYLRITRYLRHTRASPQCFSETPHVFEQLMLLYGNSIFHPFDSRRRRLIMDKNSKISNWPPYEPHRGVQAKWEQVAYHCYYRVRRGSRTFTCQGRAVRVRFIPGRGRIWHGRRPVRWWIGHFDIAHHERCPNRTHPI